MSRSSHCLRFKNLRVLRRTTMDVWEIISMEVFADLVKNVSEIATTAIVSHAEEVVDRIDTAIESQEEEKPNILNILPPEIIHRILKLVPRKDLCALRRVSHEMKTAATAPHVLKLEISKRLRVRDFERKELKPLLANITSMIVNGINRTKKRTAIEMNSDEDEIPEKIIQRIELECTNLRSLTIEKTIIPSSMSMNAHSALIERLTHLDLFGVTVKRFTHFLAATYPNLKEFYLRNCTFEFIEEPLPDEDQVHQIRMPSLEKLHLHYIDKFGDKQFHQLTQSNLSKVTELQLFGLPMTGEDFFKVNFANLRELYLVGCEFDAEWLSQLKHLRKLETLNMSSSNLKDTCSPDTFKHMTQLRRLYIGFCDIGNRTMSAMARYLPNLIRWEVTPNEDGMITDLAFRNFTHQRDHLEEIVFDRMQLSDTTLRQLVVLAPNLTELSLCVCSASDETIALIGQLKNLVKLTLQGTRITDAGLAALEPKLAVLKSMSIDSRFVTAAGFQRALPLFAEAQTVCITFGEPECEMKYFGEEFADRRPYLSVKGLTSELILLCLNECKDLRFVSFENVTLTVVELETILISDPKLACFMVTHCEMNEEAAACLGRLLVLTCKELSVYQCHVSAEVVLKLLQSMQSKERWEQVYIENETFLSNEQLKEVLPIASHCGNFEIRTLNEDYLSIAVHNHKRYKELNFDGGLQIDDDIILDVVRQFPKMKKIVLTDTLVTVAGLFAIGHLLPHLTNFAMKSTTIGDEAMAVIGNDFPSLRVLTLEVEGITDAGLEALGKQYWTIDTLTITRSAITEDGVRLLASKLTAIRYLNVYQNPNITRELHGYMLAAYPGVEPQEYPEPDEDEEAEEEDEEEAGAVEQQQAENGQLAEDQAANLEVPVVEPVVAEPQAEAQAEPVAVEAQA